MHLRRCSRGGARRPPNQRSNAPITLRAVRAALDKSPALQHRSTQVFLHGSYRNRTNVRSESDVDVGIVCSDTFFYDLPSGYTKTDFSIVDASYHYDQFKSEVGQALIEHFGASSVARGNKAFDIKENTYRVEADVAPFFEHRRYNARGGYHSGVELHPDNGGKVINWPEQHYENGVAKNKRTHRRYKAMVRVLKHLRNDMVDDGISEAGPVPGFLNECLVWNVPDAHLEGSDYISRLRSALSYLFGATSSEAGCGEWGEVSELKYLFRGGQKWTRNHAHQFTAAAWRYAKLG